LREPDFESVSETLLLNWTYGADALRTSSGPKFKAKSHWIQIVAGQALRRQFFPRFFPDGLATKDNVGERINLMFRQIVEAA
jgi:hypothetical protein